MWVETYDKQFINLDKMAKIKIEIYPYANAVEDDDYVLKAEALNNPTNTSYWLFRGEREDCEYCRDALYLALKNNFNCITFNNERV